MKYSVSNPTIPIYDSGFCIGKYSKDLYIKIRDNHFVNLMTKEEWFKDLSSEVTCIPSNKIITIET